MSNLKHRHASEVQSPEALHHALLRPCVLHILRAAGYQATRPSVLDKLTDLTATYMTQLAQTVVTHAELNHGYPDLSLEISVQDVRMAMEDFTALPPERFGEGEDESETVDELSGWAMGPVNKEIRRIGLEGSDGAKDDYLTILKKRHSTTGDEEARYVGTVVGKPAEPRAIKIEGSEVSSVKEWAERLKRSTKVTSTLPSSRRQSSALSSLGDATIESMEF